MLSALSLALAQMDTWDLFQKFCIVVTTATVVVGTTLAVIKYFQREYASSEALKEAREQFEKELVDFEKAYEIQRIADQARFDKLEADYDETIRLLSISRMLHPGQPINRPRKAE